VRLQLVKVDHVENLERACAVLREHFAFEQWRIVNIAEVLPRA